MREHSVISGMVFLLLLLVIAVSAAPADRFAGKWKLNLARSRYRAGEAPRKYEVQIKDVDNGLKCTARRVGSDGKEYREEWAAKYDGKDYPMTGDPAVDTITLKKIDAGTIEVVFKKSGKEIDRSRVTVSPDGKTTTVIAKDAVLILEKQ